MNARVQWGVTAKISGISTRSCGGGGEEQSHKRSWGGCRGQGGVTFVSSSRRFNIHESFLPFYRPLSANIRRLNTHVIIIIIYLPTTIRHNRHKNLQPPGTILHTFAFDVYTRVCIQIYTLANVYQIQISTALNILYLIRKIWCLNGLNRFMRKILQLLHEYI